MKKNIASIGLGLMLAAAIARAAAVYHATLVNQGVTYNHNFTLNLNSTPNSSGMTHVSAQAVYSTASLPTDTFTDGRVSTATITVSSVVGLSSASATNKITVAADAVIQSSAASNSLVVTSTNGLTGARITLNGQIITNNGWRVNVASNTAADIATELNSLVYKVIANAHGTSTVTLVTRARGTVGNSYTLSSSTPTALTAGASHFSGGQNSAFMNQYITVNGVRYLRGYSWNLPTDVETSTGTAASLATLLNRITGIQAHAVNSVVFATATVYGTASNAFTLTSSTPTALTVLTPTFAGGVDNAVVTVNGVALTQGAQWTKGVSATLTAASIAAAINASSSLNTLVVSTNVAGVVRATSTIVGTVANFALTSSTPSAIAVSHPTFVGGQNSAYTINSPTIYIPSHGYPTGAAVLFSGAAAVPAPLATQTTYYTILVDPNDVQLATTSARAAAGQYLTFSSSSTTGPHTFTLTPLPYLSGAAGMQWLGSNDGVNYNPVSVSSITLSSPPAANTSTVWDFKRINYKYLQLDVAAPTQGSLNLVVTVNGSN